MRLGIFLLVSIDSLMEPFMENFEIVASNRTPSIKVVFKTQILQTWGSSVWVVRLFLIHQNPTTE